MSTLFGYKSKIIKDGLYEVFEPVADARYILSKVFKHAFDRVKKPNKGGVPSVTGGKSRLVSGNNMSARGNQTAANESKNLIIKAGEGSSAK